MVAEEINRLHVKVRRIYQLSDSHFHFLAHHIEELCPTPSLHPDMPQGRARMNQWISAVNS
jgi:hypothetical protein